MTTFYTGGQSFEDIARDFTLSPEYGPAIAIHNNYEGQSITGHKYYITVPDNWMKPEYSGKTITLPDIRNSGSELIAGVPNWALFAGAAILFLTMK